MTVNVFVNQDNTATFICPRCEKSKTVRITKHKERKKAVRVKCSCACGNTNIAVLERRRHYRKTTHFRGIYLQLVSGREVGKGIMTVKDISHSGLKLRIDTDRKINVGERLITEFRLDDPQKTLIRKEVIIKAKNGHILGVEFCGIDPNDPRDRAIGFYLFSA